MVPGLQGPQLGPDPEQLADEVFDVRREVDDQLGFRLVVERGRVEPGGVEPGFQGRVAPGEALHEGGIEFEQALAAVEVVEGQAETQGVLGAKLHGVRPGYR